MKRWVPFLLPFTFYLLPSHARAGNYTTAVLNEAPLRYDGIADFAKLAL